MCVCAQSTTEAAAARGDAAGAAAAKASLLQKLLSEWRACIYLRACSTDAHVTNIDVILCYGVRGTSVAVDSPRRE